MKVEIIKKLFFDILGIYQICGFAVAHRFILSCVVNLPSVVRERNLQPADRAMGEGPFLIRIRGGRPFRVRGVSVLSGIREMFVRNTYMRNALIRISDGDVVLDLGANLGNFTNLALAQGLNVTVVAVEPSLAMNRAFYQSVGLNEGFLERTTLVRAFLGARVEKVMASVSDDPNYRGVEWIDETELLSRTKLERVDFLKCDIEGGEFGLLNRQSKLLGLAKTVAVEVHAFAGDVRGFLHTLGDYGFTIIDTQWAPDGSCTVLAKRI